MAIAALSMVLSGCLSSQDLVASSYGDYDPSFQPPPVILQIDGDISVSDPSLFFWQGTYYVFSSGSEDAGGSGLDLRSSKDLRIFKREPQVLSPDPSWVQTTLPDVTVLWSPSVLAWNGTIHLYYAASWFGATRACIGHATASSMDEGFVDDGQPLICSNIDATDPYVAIDPAVILDDAGYPWMTFGSFEKGIHILALNREGRRLDEPTNLPFVVAARGPDEYEAIQASSLYHWRDDYYLFVSHEAPPGHILRVGRSQQVTGPYFDREGKQMAIGGGTRLFNDDDTFTGPGSNMVFDDGKQRLNVYHAYNATGDIRLRIAQLFFDQDGWPVSAGP